MTLHEYAVARQLHSRLLGDDLVDGNPEIPFYSLIMAAMLRADTPNLKRLKRGWPSVYKEVEARYNAPGAVLDSD